MNSGAHFAMMRLASPALPIGGFSYSQGLECAIDKGWVDSEASLANWIQDCLALNIGRYEAPLTWALCDAIARDHEALATGLHQEYLASRESAELHAESLQMGYSLLRLLAGLTDNKHRAISRARVMLDAQTPCALPMAWALAGAALQLTPEQSLHSYLWAWFENQIAAAIKAVPLGQQSGQRLMEQLSPALARTAEQAPHLPRDTWSNFAPGFAMASCWHEDQYSRLFRS